MLLLIDASNNYPVNNVALSVLKNDDYVQQQDGLIIVETDKEPDCTSYFIQGQRLNIQRICH